jgi:hypothetical protein
MKRAVADYGRKLTLPPAEAWAKLNMVEMENAARPRYLSPLATFVGASERKYQISLDDIRVL